MPAAHVCPSCGIDLADIAPVREQFYALLVRFCPQCRAPHPVWPGGKHPITRGWRTARLLIRSLRSLVHRAIALGFVAGASIGFAALGPDLARVQLSPAQLLHPRPGEPGLSSVAATFTRAADTAEWVLIAPVGAALCGIALGILASTFWRHLSLLGAWLFLGAWVALMASAEGLIVLADAAMHPTAQAWTLDRWLNALGLPMLFVALTPLGFLPGVAFAALGRATRRKLWSRALRSARRRRRA